MAVHVQTPNDPNYLPGAVSVRQAVTADTAGIAALVDDQAGRLKMLPRLPEEIQSSIGDWLVAERYGDIVGCVSLLQYASGLVEVRSLAVCDPLQRNGVGSRLIEALIAEAKRRGVSTLFALTRSVSFFLRMGFTVTGKELFPEKVWRDCRQCPLLEACDETAVVLPLREDLETTPVPVTKVTS